MRECTGNPKAPVILHLSSVREEYQVPRIQAKNRDPRSNSVPRDPRGTLLVVPRQCAPTGSRDSPLILIGLRVRVAYGGILRITIVPGVYASAVHYTARCMRVRPRIRLYGITPALLCMPGRVRVQPVHFSA